MKESSFAWAPTSIQRRALDETIATLARFAPGIAIATIPRVKAPVGARDAFAELVRLL